MEAYQATFEDLEGVSRLFNLYREFYRQPSDPEGAKSYIRARLENEESIIFTVRNKDNEYLGFTQLYPTFSSISMKNAWTLNDLYVDANARKHGIGKLLLQKAKELALDTGAAGISLSTAADNHAAQRLYEKNGYVREVAFYHYELDPGAQ